MLGAIGGALGLLSLLLCLLIALALCRQIGERHPAPLQTRSSSGYTLHMPADEPEAATDALGRGRAVHITLEVPSAGGLEAHEALASALKRALEGNEPNPGRPSDAK